MNVDLALFRGDELLCRGEINITATRASSEFSGHDNVTLSISHAFAMPACSLSVRLRRQSDASGESEELLEAGLAMGVHESDDWESVALGPDFTLGFLCQPIS